MQFDVKLMKFDVNLMQFDVNLMSIWLPLLEPIPLLSSEVVDEGNLSESQTSVLPMHWSPQTHSVE
jgi:hypothetical protein